MAAQDDTSDGGTEDRAQSSDKVNETIHASIILRAVYFGNGGREERVVTSCEDPVEYYECDEAGARGFIPQG
jgi:hypothetical protein